MFKSIAWALAAMSLVAGPALAQSPYPDRGVKLVVPLSPGGPSDVLGRLVAAKLTDALGKPVVVENRPGAGGNIGTDMVAKSRADGYTLLLNNPSVLAINESLYKQVPFDAARDLRGVARFASSQFILVANPAFAPNSPRELVAFAKSHPTGSVAFASPGIGSPQHIGGELLNSRAGIKLNHIAYKGAAPALTDLLGGQIPLAIVGLPAAIQYVKGGRLKAIAVFGAERSPLAPEVPTFVESGFPEIEMELVYGLFAPRGTPQPVVDRLFREMDVIFKTPEVREKLVNAGFAVGVGKPEDLDNYMKSEVQKWRPLVRDSGATAD